MSAQRYLLTFATILMLFLAVSLHAQETENSVESSGEVSVGVWGNYVKDDSSKAEEYGEVPEGFLINRFDSDFEFQNDRYLDFDAVNIGLNNAQYGFGYGIWGKYRLNINYSKIPHLFSKSGETIWTETAPGIWTLPDSLQTAIQNLNPNLDPATFQAGLAAQRFFISNLLTNAHPVPLELQRNRGAIAFSYTPSVPWKYDFEYFRENRDGNRPFGTAFGFSWTTELPEHIDYNTERLHLGVEYAKNGKSFVAAYDLSLFFNEVETMIWDNPYRVTDRTYDLPSPIGAPYTTGDGTSRGRTQLPVDNMSNTFSLGGATKFGESRLTGSFAYSLWTDEVDLLPFTINSAIPEIPLPAEQFNGEYRNLTANLRYTTPVGQRGDFTANYRLYDLANESDQFLIGEYVRFDQIIEHRVDDEGNPLPNPLYAFTTNTLDLDFRWELTDRLNWHAGYAYNRWDRDFRDVNRTNENLFRTAIDATASDWLALRASYTYSQRRFDELELHNPTYTIIPLRRYDIANVNRNQFRLIADLVPSEKTTLGFTAGVGKDDFIDSEFGVVDLSNYLFGVDFSYALNQNSSLNLWYEREQFSRDQIGRQSGGTPSTNPLDNWDASVDDQYDTVGIGYTTRFRDGKVSWDTNFTYSRSDGDVDLFSPPGGTPNVAMSLENSDETDLFIAKTGLQFRIFNRLRLGTLYWFERYLIDDFAEDTIQTDLVVLQLPTGAVAFPGSILLNAIQPKYTYHTGWIGFLYSW